MEYLFESFIRGSVLTGISMSLACVLTLGFRAFAKTPAIRKMSFPVFWCVIQWLVCIADVSHGHTGLFSHVMAVFATAWALVRVSFVAVHGKSLRYCIVVATTGLSVLYVTGWSKFVVKVLDKLSFSVGSLHLSVLALIKIGCVFAALMWTVSLVSKLLERHLSQAQALKTSTREIIFKFVRVTLTVSSILVSLSIAGVDLSSLTMFGGAIILGLGFGLQKVIANLVCGFILLVDRSVGIGDVITLDDGKSFGTVDNMGIRFVSIVTPSGQSHLIPNENFVVNKVENWSLKGRAVKIDITMRAPLNADPEVVLECLKEAAKGIDHVVADKSVSAYITGFTDSAMELLLKVWIDDPLNGILRVKTEVYTNICRLFKEKGINIPHAQRDLYVHAKERETLSNIPKQFQTSVVDDEILSSVDRL